MSLFLSAFMWIASIFLSFGLCEALFYGVTFAYFATTSADTIFLLWWIVIKNAVLTSFFFHEPKYAFGLFWRFFLSLSLPVSLCANSCKDWMTQLCQFMCAHYGACSNNDALIVDNEWRQETKRKQCVQNNKRDKPSNDKEENRKNIKP